MEESQEYVVLFNGEPVAPKVYGHTFRSLSEVSRFLGQTTIGDRVQIGAVCDIDQQFEEGTASPVGYFVEHPSSEGPQLIGFRKTLGEVELLKQKYPDIPLLLRQVVSLELLMSNANMNYAENPGEFHAFRMECPSDKTYIAQLQPRRVKSFEETGVPGRIAVYQALPLDVNPGDSVAAYLVELVMGSKETDFEERKPLKVASTWQDVQEILDQNEARDSDPEKTPLSLEVKTLVPVPWLKRRTEPDNTLQ